ncbi:YlbF family regulator [Loigolactobacillus backii]|uniref:Uncharacterized protein n=1 Tax=Loigolactobacillus backii TaxID=375175 RepID=A0A192H438_9LACO|nr:YlbF family regulator [Loigolactobacillus backii]ANK63589.1 hypothetical protein AYR53_10265 [Loigolactobacillus backii]ANK70920.1 hypothetical protein AYR56_06740 [Loigolactobacillus backii]MDA5387114.1 YlbF family regulator [Loigolactobacillus backii]MDA5389663.1 YlbF family regulator [Loigolactobacillus backii]PIO84400.1 hypothetical protein BSQ39_08715 [Loigolactobacillus backii]
MIITENLLEVTDQVDTLVASLKQSDVYKTYLAAKANLAVDTAAEKKIQGFREASEKFDLIKDYGSYAPDFKKLRRTARHAKRQVDLDPTVAHFRRSEMDLQTILDEIGLAIANSVSKDVKVATGNPFFTTGRPGKHCQVKG